MLASTDSLVCNLQSSMHVQGLEPMLEVGTLCLLYFANTYISSAIIYIGGLIFIDLLCFFSLQVYLVFVTIHKF